MSASTTMPPPQPPSRSGQSSPSTAKAPPPAAAPPKPSASTAAAPPPIRTPAPPGLLHADLGHLLETKEGADVEIEVCGEVFAAHKTVLAARSPVLKDDFFGRGKEKDTSYMRISGMRLEVFEALLNYMYTDSLPEMKMAMNSLEQKGAGVLAEDMLVAAVRFGMKGLKSLAEDKLCNQVGVSTVLLTLPLAEKYQCCKLKKKCLGFISSCANARAIVASNDFENLARSNPSVVKDVINEILDTSEARSRRLIDVCFYAFVFLLLFLVFAVLKKQ